MGAVLGKMALKKVVKGKNSKKQEVEDPYHEWIPSKKMGVSYLKKVDKRLDPLLTPVEKEVLLKVRRRAKRYDEALNIPKIGRFGWSSVIGLIPVVGDMLDSLLAWLLFRTCCSVEPGLPTDVRNKMIMNIVFDFVIGFVPLLGDFADALYKCNTKNLVLLDKELKKRAEQRRRDGGRIPDQAAGHEATRQYMMEQPRGSSPQYTSNQKPRRPEPAYDPQESQGRSGYMGDHREVDLEAGEGIPPQQHFGHQSSRSYRPDGNVYR